MTPQSGIPMDNRERFGAIRDRFGQDIGSYDTDAVISYAEGLGFPRMEMTFLRVLGFPENDRIRRMITDGNTDIGLLSEKIWNELGFDRGFVRTFIEDVRQTMDNARREQGEDRPRKP